VLSEHVALGVVEGHKVVGPIARYPAEGSGADLLRGMPADEIVRIQADEVKATGRGRAAGSDRLCDARYRPEKA